MAASSWYASPSWPYHLPESPILVHVMAPASVSDAQHHKMLVLCSKLCQDLQAAVADKRALQQYSTIASAFISRAITM